MSNDDRPDVPESQEDEIARLSDEVDSLLRGWLNMWVEKAKGLTCERDEAMAALNDAKKALKIMNQNLDDLSRAKQEALAQVAVLILALEDALSEIHYNLGCDSRCEEKRHVLVSPLIKARALLDRLAMLEDGAMTNQRLVWLEDLLERAEAVVRDLVVLGDDWIDVKPAGFYRVLRAAQEIVATWEKGKQTS